MKSVVFMGTPDFAVPALESLIKSDEYDVKLVVSQTDKPQGRHQELVAPPVKQIALQYGIEVFQPKTLKTDEAYEKIASYKPDFIIVAAYGKILPQRVLDIPVYGCVNLHGSLLPKYRGAAPIQWSVINGEKKTGLTSMLMDAGLDTGDILLVSETEIGENETAGELFDRLAEMGPELLFRTLSGLADGEIAPVKQNEEEATYVSVLSKEMAAIDWNESALSIHNKIRGMSPWPVAKTSFDGKLLKVYSSLVTDRRTNGIPGTLSVCSGRIYVACGDGMLLEITELQLEGAKRMSAADFLRGHQSADGVILGKQV